MGNESLAAVAYMQAAILIVFFSFGIAVISLKKEKNLRHYILMAMSTVVIFTIIIGMAVKINA